MKTKQNRTEQNETKDIRAALFLCRQLGVPWPEGGCGPILSESGLLCARTEGRFRLPARSHIQERPEGGRLLIHLQEKTRDVKCMPSGNHEAAARCSKLSSQLKLQHLTWSSLHAAHDHHYKLSGADHPVQIIQCRLSVLRAIT